MADNINVTAGSGKTIGADEVSSVLYQRIKIIEGADGTNDGDVSATNPLPVELRDVDTTLVADVGAIKTSVQTLDNAISGNEMQVDVLTMPTTTVQATDLDVRNLTSTDVVTVTGGVGQTADVKITLDGESVPVTNAGTFAVQVDGSALTSLQLIDDAIYTSGSGTPSKGTLALGSDGTNPRAIAVDASGNVQVDIVSGGSSGTQYTEGDTDASITGTAALVEGAANALAVLTQPLTDTQLRASDVKITLDGESVPVTGTFWQATQPVSSVADDWDESDRAKVNIIVGQAGITAGAGAVAANTPRVTHASDDPVTTSVQLLDDAIVADDAGFTPATTKVMMAGFEFDDTSPDTVNEGDAGAARMSANRNIYTTIRDAAGNERGLNVDANGAIAVTQGTATNLKAQAECYQGGSAVAEGNPLQVSVANTGANGTAIKVNVASGGIASGAIASGAVASGAFASGSIASGAIVAGAIAAGATSFVKLEDVASADADAGVPAMAIRKGTPVNTSGTDGDYEMLQMSAGRLWTSATIDTALPSGTNNIGDVDILSIAAGDNNIGNVDIVTVPAPLSTTGNGTAATALRVTVASDSTGVVGLATGSNAIGKLAANSGVDIGDVDVTSIVPGTGATNLGKSEDASHTSADVGVMALGVRTDVPNAVGAGTTGDYSFVATDMAGGVRTALYETDFAVLGTNHVKKYYTNAGAVTDGIVWSPAAGKRWYITDLVINVSAAATVTLEDDKAGGDEAVMKFELAANSGITHSFNTPLFSGEDAADLLVTTSAGNVYITVTGYEI